MVSLPDGDIITKFSIRPGGICGRRAGPGIEQAPDECGHRNGIPDNGAFRFYVIPIPALYRILPTLCLNVCCVCLGRYPYRKDRIISKTHTIELVETWIAGCLIAGGCLDHAACCSR